MTDTGSPLVRDDPGRSRLVVEQDGAEAELVYRRNGNRLVLVHTGVPEQLGGRGIGGQLVTAALDRAAAEGLTVVPRCPYARKWIQDHPDAAAGVTVDWQSKEEGRG
jgi:predicted GNAT family acetyltransferase